MLIGKKTGNLTQRKDLNLKKEFEKSSCKENTVVMSSRDN